MTGLFTTLAALAIVGTLSAPGAWAQTADGDEGFMDMTLPDLSPATVDPDGTYVDPQIRNRGECLDHPGRPAWVMVQPKGMEWRGRLLRAYGKLQIWQTIVESGDCGCDNRYPDWETFRPAMMELLSEFEEERLLDLPKEQRDNFYDLERDLMRGATRIGVELGRTCRGTK